MTHSNKLKFVVSKIKEFFNSQPEVLCAVGDEVIVRNASDLLRNSGNKRFEDFEGKLISLFGHPFGGYGEVKTDNGIRVFDTDVHIITRKKGGNSSQG